MIINVRGTSGSGKSTLVRRVMERFNYKKPVKVDGRKQPYYYELTMLPFDPRPLFVLGHYETACGGVDTLKSMDEIDALVRKLQPLGNVLYEGLLISSEYQRVTKLGRDFPGRVHVVMLETPLEKCVEQINQRRVARGNEKPVNPKNTISKFKSTLSVQNKLRREGLVSAPILTFDRALDHVKVLLGV